MPHKMLENYMKQKFYEYFNQSPDTYRIIEGKKEYVEKEVSALITNGWKTLQGVCKFEEHTEIPIPFESTKYGGKSKMKKSTTCSPTNRTSPSVGVARPFPKTSICAWNALAAPTPSAAIAPNCARKFSTWWTR